MKRALRNIAVTFLVIIVAAVGGAVWFFKFRSQASVDRPPVVADVPPLSPVTRSSLIVTPVVIPVPVIHAAIETAIPPTMSGKPHYENVRRTCVLPVKLEPGKTYVIWLNPERFQGFRDTDGRPAVFYPLVFETKP